MFYKKKSKLFLKFESLKIIKIKNKIFWNNKKFKIFLKYHNNRPSLKEIKVYSKPGRRYYCSSQDVPVIKNGLGDCILSTNKGLMTGYKAKNLSVGGEILFSVFELCQE